MTYTNAEPHATAAPPLAVYPLDECDFIDAVRMVDTLDALWEAVRRNIAADPLCKGDPEGGTFGPVGGIDWVLTELTGKVYEIKRKFMADAEASTSEPNRTGGAK